MPDRSIIFDPRMWITGPLASCPKCGGNEQRQRASATTTARDAVRLGACWYTATTKPPKLKKNIVYLNEMALSNMAKELDPEWGARTRRRDPFWGRKRTTNLERLVKLQVLVCPSYRA